MPLFRFLYRFYSSRNSRFVLGQTGKRMVVLVASTISLAGCTSFSTSSLPSFGFGGSTSSLSPDCREIEKRMSHAHKKYALALGREKPAVYLTFTGNLSRTMKGKRLRGLHEMTQVHLTMIVNKTRNACIAGKLGRSTCQGAVRLGKAYKPLVLAARQAHENYCGSRPIR